MLLERELQGNHASVRSSEGGPTEFVTMGLDIETEQYVIAHVHANLSMTWNLRCILQADVDEQRSRNALDSVNFAERRLSLRYKI